MNHINSWKEALNWETVPTFQAIHGLPAERFLGCYYIPETVNQYLATIINSLENGYGFAHKTIVGDPGIGKTTFVYYIKVAIKTHELDKLIHIEVIHIQRLVAGDKFEGVITNAVLNIFRRYFATNQLQEVFEDITANEKNDKISINNLKSYIIENRHSIKKRMIIIIDDVDETSEELVELSLRFLFTLIECEQISRWLIARSTTLDNYKISLINFIETKFQQKSVFPKVDLHGILEERIKFDNPEGHNPFIPKLCHQILSAHNNDLRMAVSNCISFLDNLSPPSTAKNNPKFAGEFLLRNFTKVMTQIDRFPNLYRNSILKTVPIEKDVFLILASKSRFISGYLSVLENHYRRVYETVFNKNYAGSSYLINIDMDHINRAIDILINNRLLFLHSRESQTGSFYILTPKGEIFVRFLTENLYTETARKLAKRDNQPRHKVFWVLADMAPDYEPQNDA